MRNFRRATATVALACVLFTSGFAQQMGAPPDVPKGHWAYAAVDALFREGILKGYPDGLFRGGRPLVRYELGALQALNLTFAAMPFSQGTQTAALVAFRNDLRRLQSQMAELKATFSELPALKQKLEALTKQLADLRRQVDEIKAKGG